MFGYVIPDKLNMYIKDFNVFQSFYCGLCKTLGETGAEFTRLCTNYDVTFYNVLLHSLTNTPVEFERKLCAYNGKKKVVVKTDELSKRLPILPLCLSTTTLRTTCTTAKITSDSQRYACSAQEKGGEKALQNRQNHAKSFADLRKLEKEKCDSIDRVADTFATLMRDMTRQLIKTDDNVDTFCYNLGRLIYLLDAVDDVEKDSKSGEYNPLVLNYGKCAEKKDYLAKNADELSFLLNSTYNKMVGSYNAMDIKMYEGVLSNTIYLGIKMQVERLLKGDDKCRLTRL